MTKFCGSVIMFGMLCSMMQSIAAEQREATPAVVNPAVRSPLRPTISLDGTWDFATDPDSKGDGEQWFLPDKEMPDTVPIRVPACWEAQGIGGPGQSTPSTGERNINPLRGSYVGTAWYKKEVSIPEGWADKRIWLKVGGIHAQGWLWVNGTYIAHVENYCGTYKYDITDLVEPAGKAVIAAKVRNDVTSGKGLFSWVQRFGGLYRSIEIEATPSVFIDNAYVEGDLDRKKATVHVRLRSMEADSQLPIICKVDAEVSAPDGTAAGRETGQTLFIGAGIKEVQIDVPLDPFLAWSPSAPNLYKVQIVLKIDGKEVDGWAERFGVRKWEVRGDSFYLNNKKFLVRGYGDDHIYPLALCSPADRKVHKKNLQVAKDFGFVYVRHHTHCEVPEFFEAADEVGIMVQPELPYYSTHPSARDKDKKWFRPKEDLTELITHYRRYVSLSTYCTGNEGYMGAPLDKEIYQLAKKLDPSRLIVHQDGGRGNNAENSDYWTIPHEPDLSKPTIVHEYMNLGTDEDPRLAPKYTGAVMPPCLLEPFKKELEDTGLSLDWGYKCIDAGNELQRIYQKRGLEKVRRSTRYDGYSFWTILDCGRPSAQGLFNQFWEPKIGTAEEFRRFNGPSVVLAEFSPGERILAEGDELKIEWWISHFGDAVIKDTDLTWKLTDTRRRFLLGRKTFRKGKLRGISAERGDIEAIGETTITIPSLKKAVKAELSVELAGTGIRNSWDIWLFPKIKAVPGAGEDMCASEEVYKVLSERYPGMTKLGSAESADAEIILADALDPDVVTALDAGKKVILLKLKGINPGVKLGWWWKCPQVGTAVAKHPAFGDFLHNGYLGEQFFRLTHSTVQMNKGGYNDVDHLMLGYGYNRRAEFSGGRGNLGYLLYAYQAKAGNGRILGSGLNLLSEHPEAAYLLNEFIKYVKSGRFKPEGVLDVEKITAK